MPLGPVGITNIGFGGCNVHAIIHSNIKEKSSNNHLDIPRVVIASGRTKQAVKSILDGAETNKHDAEFLGLLDKIHEQESRKHPYRGFAVLHNSSMLMKYFFFEFMMVYLKFFAYFYGCYINS